MPTLLLTGANRGLGLEFARQYASDRWRVLATCRAPEHASELCALTDSAPVENAVGSDQLLQLRPRSR